MILEDSRQQAGKHNNIHQYFRENDIRFDRCKLYVGDYTVANDGRIAVDTKKDIAELAMNLNMQHERFRRECLRAQNAEIRLIVLIEEALPKGGLENWKPPGNALYKVSPKALQRQMITIQERYGVKFRFCDPSETGNYIIRYLTGTRNEK